MIGVSVKVGFSSHNEWLLLDVGQRNVVISELACRGAVAHTKAWRVSDCRRAGWTMAAQGKAREGAVEAEGLWGGRVAAALRCAMSAAMKVAALQAAGLDVSRARRCWPCPAPGPLSQTPLKRPVQHGVQSTAAAGPTPA